MSTEKDTARRQRWLSVRRFVALCLLLGGALIGMQPALAVQQLHETPKQQLVPLCDTPQEAVQIFLKAVDRDELTIFNEVIGRSMITPVRVEFVYEIGRTVPVVTVHSRLKKPLDIPGNTAVEVRAVTAVLDGDGSIVETKAHAYPREDADD